jgi:hypothetical protein
MRDGAADQPCVRRTLSTLYDYLHETNSMNLSSVKVPDDIAESESERHDFEAKLWKRRGE